MNRLTIMLVSALFLTGCGDEFVSPAIPYGAPVLAQWKQPTVNPFEGLSQVEITWNLKGKNWDAMLRAKTQSGKWAHVMHQLYGGCAVAFGGGACMSSKTKMTWLRDALIVAAQSAAPAKAKDIGFFLAILDREIRETNSP